MVFVVEGEKCADYLAALGLAAVTSPHGAQSGGKADWTPLHGRDVIFIPDSDGAGEGYARTVAEKLSGKAKSIKIATLPGLDEGGDIVDWLRAGGTREKLMSLVEKTPELRLGDSIPPQNLDQNFGGELKARTPFRPLPIGEFYKATPEKIPWIIEPLIPRGTLCALAGLMKVGKTELYIQLAASLACGGEFLGYGCRKASVLILALEGHPSELRRRFTAHGIGGEENVFIHAGRLQNTFDQIEEILLFVKSSAIDLVVLDSWAAFAGVGDENDNAKVLQALNPIRHLIRQTGAAALLIVHSKKSGGNFGTQIRGAGSLFGELDQALILERRQGGADTNRVLNVIGRYSESPPETILDYVNGRYAALGAPSTVKRDEIESRVTAALDGGALTVGGVADEAGIPVKLARRTLEKLRAGGKVKRGGAGKRNDPHIYTLGYE